MILEKPPHLQSLRCLLCNTETATPHLLGPTERMKHGRQSPGQHIIWEGQEYVFQTEHREDHHMKVIWNFDFLICQMGTRNNRFFPETVTEAHRSEWHPWLPRRGGWGHQELGRWEDIEGRYGGGEEHRHQHFLSYRAGVWLETMAAE